jgi:NitT/TauT family transport system ATP-binding protein
MQDELLALTQLAEDPPTVVMVTHSLSEALVLSDRVVVLSSRPGHILEDVELPFGRPRLPEVRDHPAFVALEQQLWDVLRTEVAEAAEDREP